MTEDNPPTAMMYGSGLLPTRTMAIKSTVDKAKPKYEEERRYGDREILRRSAVDLWAYREKEAREGGENGIEMMPVKVDGFKRKYDLETSYGGTMLDIEKDEKEWMNAVVISGLSEEEKEELDSSESSYETVTVDLEDVEPYLEEQREVLEEEFDNGDVELYIGEPRATNRTRNQTYHDRIRTGIDMIGESLEAMYEEVDGEELAEEMWREFKQTTYEAPIAGFQREEPEPRGHMDVPEMVQNAWRDNREEWLNTVEQNDRAEEAFGKLMEDTLLEE
jgi:vacuolar-type H+-ATPase subunit I/STV1